MSRIGILAGGGGLPVAVAEGILRAGHEVYFIGLTGEADRAIERFPHIWSNMGGVGRIVRTFRNHGCAELVIVGSVRRPDLGKLRPDLGFVSNFPAIMRLLFGGDDSVLSRVVRFFEQQGFIVRGAHEMAPELVVNEGELGAVEPGPQDSKDIALGLSVISTLGPLDVGQAVIVADGVVLSIEGAEGTDRMLERCVSLRVLAGKNKNSYSGVLIKRPKPGQEIRVDMPTIGPRTVELAAKAQLAGIAALSGEVLVADRANLTARADELGVFVSGVRFPKTSSAASVTADDDCAIEAMKNLGRRRPGRRNRSDISKGVRVLTTLNEFGAGRAVVVSRDYVVAVSGIESTADMLERCGSLRQWGTRASSRRVGVLVSRPDTKQDDMTNEVFGWDAMVAAAANAGLAGIALLGSAGDVSEVEASLVAAAESRDLFVTIVNTRS